MKVLALTCTHGRSQIVDVFLHHLEYECLIVDSNYDVLTSETDIMPQWAIPKEINYFSFSNKKLGEKWNFGLQQCKEVDFDYLLITGSDDIFSPGLIDHLVKQKVHYAGLLDFYFYDTERDLLKYCPGLKYDRAGEPHGAGRIIHRSVLESLNWVLWDDKINHGLDASMTKRLKTLDIKTHFCKIPDGMFAVDLKSSENIHRLEEYPGIMLDQEAKQIMLRHFNLEYV